MRCIAPRYPTITYPTARPHTFVRRSYRIPVAPPRSPSPLIYGCAYISLASVHPPAPLALPPRGPRKLGKIVACWLTPVQLFLNPPHRRFAITDSPQQNRRRAEPPNLQHAPASLPPLHYNIHFTPRRILTSHNPSSTAAVNTSTSTHMCQLLGLISMAASHGRGQSTPPFRPIELEIFSAPV